MRLLVITTATYYQLPAMAQNDSSLREYLREISRYPLLSPEQEIQLGRQVVRMQQPDCTDREQRQGRRARDKFIQSNLKLVVNIAKKYDGRQRKAMMLMDLIQEGNIGLARAVDMFDPSRGYRFTTYAYWWIKQSIHRAIANNDNMIRIPSSLHEKIIKTVKVQTMLMQQLERLPSQQEIADELGITIGEMVTAIQRNQSTSSLDATGVDLDRSAIINFIADENQSGALDAIENNDAIDKMLEIYGQYIDKTTRYIIECRLLDKPTSWRELQEQTGFGVTKLQSMHASGIIRLRLMLDPVIN
jgi:RNA polymerase primary sigma factor